MFVTERTIPVLDAVGTTSSAGVSPEHQVLIRLAEHAHSRSGAAALQVIERYRLRRDQTIS